MILGNDTLQQRYRDHHHRDRLEKQINQDGTSVEDCPQQRNLPSAEAGGMPLRTLQHEGDMFGSRLRMPGGSANCLCSAPRAEANLNVLRIKMES